MKNIRIHERPVRAEHEDFDWRRAMTPPERVASNKSKRAHVKWKAYLGELSQYDFGLLFWGHNAGKIVEVTDELGSSVFLIKDNSEKRFVRDIMESVSWQEETNGEWMGAPNFMIEEVVEVYERKKQEWKK